MGAGKGMLAGLLGLPADTLQAMAMVKPTRMANDPVLDVPFTSPEIAGLLGADPSRPSTQLGMIGTPDISDLGKLGVGALALSRRGATAVPRNLPTYTPAPQGALSPVERKIEARFAQRLDSDIEGSIEAYNRLPSTQGGKIVAVDDVRELEPLYVQDRSLSAAVHEPSSAFAKVLWERKLAEPGDGPILFMSGGTGAGKSTGVKELPPADYHAIYDSNLASFTKAKRQIDRALETGRDVDIMHVWRDPIEAFSGDGGSALTRAMKNKGNGRTVPIDAHVSTHVGANKTIRQLEKFYRNDDRVHIYVVDNSNGKGRAELSDISVVEDIDGETLRGAAHAELEKARQSGRINQQVYQGFKGRKQAAGAPVRG